MTTEEQRAAGRAHWEYYCRRAKILHKCVYCGADIEPVLEDNHRVNICRQCKNKVAKRMAERYKQRRLEHKCPCCGADTDIKPKTGKHYVYCAKCRAKINEQVHSRKLRQRKEVDNGKND